MKKTKQKQQIKIKQPPNLLESTIKITLKFSKEPNSIMNLHRWVSSSKLEAGDP